jgi:hypothetical protein
MRALSIIIAAAATLAPAVAHADAGSVEVLFTVKPPTPGKKDAVPTVEATVIGAPNMSADKFKIVDKSAKVPVELAAIQKRDYNQGTETLAVAIVMNGWELWIGNDKEAGLAEDDPTRRQGVLIELRAALDKLNFKDAGPPGSLGIVITYGDKAVVRVPMGPLQNITGSALGLQKDYAGTTGVELVKGIELALAELHKAQASRKVLIVVGDGTDTSPDAAKAQLANLKKQAAQDQVQTFAIIYRTKDSQETTVIGGMISQVSTVTTADNIAASIQNILARMADRQYLTFPGWDRKLNQGIKWDGKPHDLAIKIDKDETEPQSVPLIVWDAEPPAGFPWWIVVVSVLGGLLLIVILAAVLGRKKQQPVPLPAPMPVVAAPVPSEPPKPAGPAKTVMIGQGGDEGGFPVVGWLVPLNGPAAYQTFRLRSGGTKIGTAPPADIVVNDGFMSTNHCMIQCSPQGYTLVDGGSTNGCYVNDKRVQKHDLVDNDMVTLGKTNFKFKSIV